VGQVAPPSVDLRSVPLDSSLAARAVTVLPTLLISSLIVTAPVVSTRVNVGATPGLPNAATEALVV